MPGPIDRTNYNALVDDTGGPVPDGTPWNKARIKDVLLDPIDIGLVPGGSNTYVQYNNAGVLAGSGSLTFNPSTPVLSLTGRFDHTGELVKTSNAAIRRNNDTGYLVLAGGLAEDETHGAVLLLAGNSMGGLGGYARFEIGNAVGARFLVERGAGIATFEVSGTDGSVTFSSALSSAETWVFNGTVGNGGSIALKRAGITRGYLGTGANIVGGTSNDALALGAASTLHLSASGPSPVYTVDLDSTGFYPHSTNQLPCGKSGQLWTAVWASNGTIQTSDRRRKTDIRDSDLGLAFIERLRPVRYHWIHGDTARPQYGLLAQDLLALGVGDAFIHGSEAEGYGTSYASFTAPMIAAIQELAARLAALEQRNDDAIHR